ncbi:hypothetical protein HanPI659440_Chr11g0441821 [Helianthus annuus]|nr:hypothetical protein HanPI659440_Chr11g0441821 [Helianthus annuus]
MCIKTGPVICTAVFKLQKEVAHRCDLRAGGRLFRDSIGDETVAWEVEASD